MVAAWGDRKKFLSLLMREFPFRLRVKAYGGAGIAGRPRTSAVLRVHLRGATSVTGVLSGRGHWEGAVVPAGESLRSGSA